MKKQAVESKWCRPVLEPIIGFIKINIFVLEKRKSNEDAQFVY